MAPEAPKALAKAPIVEVKKPASATTKADVAPVATESRSVLQSITELLTRQTLAIEALLQRLDASESKMTGVQAAVVSSVIAPTHQEPVPPTVVPVASVTSSTPG